MMMLSHSPEQAAAAQQLDADLSTYEQGLRELLRGRGDPELYRELSDLFDRMQMRSTLLPRLALSWTELLITRVDLTHALWSVTSPTRISGQVVALHAKHSVVLDEVRRKCRDYGGRAQRAIR
jgi:hypothetical protein